MNERWEIDREIYDKGYESGYRKAITEILKKIKACECGIGYNEYKIDHIIEKLEKVITCGENEQVKK